MSEYQDAIFTQGIQRLMYNSTGLVTHQREPTQPSCTSEWYSDGPFETRLAASKNRVLPIKKRNPSFGIAWSCHFVTTHNNRIEGTTETSELNKLLGRFKNCAFLDSK